MHSAYKFYITPCKYSQSHSQMLLMVAFFTLINVVCMNILSSFKLQSFLLYSLLGRYQVLVRHRATSDCPLSSTQSAKSVYPIVISLCNTKKLIENTQLVYTAAPYTYTRPMPTRPPGSRAGDIPDVHTNTTFSFFLRL